MNAARNAFRTSPRQLRPAGSNPPSLLPAAGLRFGLLTDERALNLEATEARTLAKWLAALALAVDESGY
jgi:hypothetical protein